MPLGQAAVPADPLQAQGFRTQRAELPEDLWQPLYDRKLYAVNKFHEVGGNPERATPSRA
jgi:hypothetical protein